MKERFEELIKIYGKWCLSDQEGKKCFGNSCACLLCGAQIDYCVDSEFICLYCNGEEKDRMYEHCNPNLI